MVRVFVKSLLRVGPGETALDLESSSRRREFASFTINGTVQPDFLSQLFQIESPQVHRFIQALHVIITSFEYVLSGRQHLQRLVQLGLTHLWLPQVLLRVVAVHVLAGNARCRPVHSLWVHQRSIHSYQPVSNVSPTQIELLGFKECVVRFRVQRLVILPDAGSFIHELVHKGLLIVHAQVPPGQHFLKQLAGRLVLFLLDSLRPRAIICYVAHLFFRSILGIFN